jgi:hypothetical protein
LTSEPITETQYDAALREARVWIFMKYGRTPTPQENASELPKIAFDQLYIGAKLKELNIEVPLEATALFTRRIFRLQPGQSMPKAEFQKFVKNELNEKLKVDEDDFYQWVRDQVGVELLVQLYGMNGEMITSKEAEFFFRRDHETMTVQLARFSLTNYTNQIVTTNEADIQDYYTRLQTKYSLPEREQINYIHFNVTNFLGVADKIMAGMSNLDAQIDTQYLGRDTTLAFFKDDAGNPLNEEAAKAKMKDNFRMQVAKQAARTNATQLADSFLQGRKKDQLITKEEVEKFAATNGLAVVTTLPFDQKNPPRELQLLPVYLNMLFQLKTTDPEDQYRLAEATNGFYFLGLERKLPSQIQPLESVRARVIEDYRNGKALDLAHKAGSQFEAAVKAGMAKGLSFDDICASNHLKPQTLTPFSIITKSIPEIEDESEFDYYVKGAAYRMPVGAASDFAPTDAGGLLICVKARTPVDESIVKQDLPEFLAQQQAQRQAAAFNIWINRELQNHLHVAMPSSKPAAAPVPPASG